MKAEFFLSLIIPPKTCFLGTRLDGDDLYPLLSQIDRNKNFQTIFKMSWVKEKCIIIAWGLFYIFIVQRIYRMIIKKSIQKRIQNRHFTCLIKKNLPYHSQVVNLTHPFWKPAEVPSFLQTGCIWTMNINILRFDKQKDTAAFNKDWRVVSSSAAKL